LSSSRSQGIVQVSQRVVDIGEVLIADLQTCNDLAGLRIKLTVATERAGSAVAYGKQLTGIDAIFAVGRQSARRNIRQLLVAHVDAVSIQDRTTIVDGQAISCQIRRCGNGNVIALAGDIDVSAIKELYSIAWRYFAGGIA